MKRKRISGIIPIFCVLALPLGAQEPRNEMRLGSVSAEFGSETSVDLTLSNMNNTVQGLVAVFDWDGTVAAGMDLAPSSLLSDDNADVVVTRVEPTFMVLGVVMDNDGQPGPNGPQEIPPSNQKPIDVPRTLATITLSCLPPPAGEEEMERTTALEFKDGTYATVDGGPLLDNIVVVGGLSIGEKEGLFLTNGQLRCIPTPDKFFIAEGAGAFGNALGDASVRMINMEEVEGFVVALCHERGVLELTLENIQLGAASQGAEFVAPEVRDDGDFIGGTIGVVLDFEDPFLGQTIPPSSTAQGNEIAVFSYRCLSPPTREQGPQLSDLIFCDNVLGQPVKENVIVIGGLSKGAQEDLVLENGQFACNPPTGEICDNGIDDDGDGLIDGQDPDCVETECNDGLDNDDDGLIDDDDPDCQQAFACGSIVQDVNGNPLPRVTGNVGGSAQVCLYIKTPEDNAVGQRAQFDHVQGFSMSIQHCCFLQVIDQTLDVTGTIVEALGAEFVSVNADNDPNDGDDCEVIVGVLIDALPPFDGATIPPMDDFQRVGCLTFNVVDDNAACGQICDIEFVDNLDGSGKVPVKNLISVENVSRGVTTFACEVEIVGPAEFRRGDCNFSQMGAGMAVDVSDAAAVVSFLFLPGDWKFEPPCLDACDCNDDGRIDLADAICILQYYLQNGRPPPLPGPGFLVDENGEFVLDDNGDLILAPPGEDPTPDKLDCEAGRLCKIIGENCNNGVDDDGDLLIDGDDPDCVP